MLPDIDIKTDGPAWLFFERLKSLNIPWLSREVSDGEAFGSPEMIFFNFRLSTIHEKHKELGFQFFAERDAERVEVEVRALRWNGEASSATREGYLEAAIELVKPVLRVYNSTFSTRLRIRVREVQYGPKPSKKTLELLNKFTGCANTSCLHHRDWHRFYRFVAKCRQYLSEETMVQLLQQRGFDRKYAIEVAASYRHLMEYKIHFCRR